MSETFSTSGLSVVRQFPYFREAICEAVARLGAMRRGHGPFHAEVRTQAFGGIRFTEVKCDPVTIQRTRADIARDPRASFFFTLQLAGQGCVSQCGREAQLAPGDFTLVDGTEPYTLRFDAPVHRLVVQVEWQEIQRRTGRDLNPRAVAFRSGMPGTRLVFDAWRSLHAESRALPPPAQSALASHVLDLAASAMLLAPPAAGASGDGDALLARVHAYLRANLRDPDLAPRTAALAIGISLRRLHRLFRDSGTSFGTWVREQRLDRCHADLRDDAQARRSISEIAFAHGFNDATHFSRCFARHFGHPPRALRPGAHGRPPRRAN